MTTIAERARAAVPYGLPTVDLHRILVNFALDPGSPEFKAPLNAINHTRGLADPSDVSVVAMNVDTPYSWAWLDLRPGPVVLAMPPHPADRYMSAQIVDLYTNILGYVSPRTFGNDGGAYAVRGPAGGVPGNGVTAVFECPTDLALVLIRTQLFDDEDLAAVAALQDQVSVTALGAPRPMPPGVPTVDVRAPLDRGFLRSLDWMLQFMPVLPEDTGIREILGGLGVGVGTVDAVLSESRARRTGTRGPGPRRPRRGGPLRHGGLVGGAVRQPRVYAGDYLSRAAGALRGSWATRPRSTSVSATRPTSTASRSTAREATRSPSRPMGCLPSVPSGRSPSTTRSGTSTPIRSTATCWARGRSRRWHATPTGR